MEIQNIFNPVKESKDGNPEVLTEMTPELKMAPGELENVLQENMDVPSARIPESNDKAELSGEAVTDEAGQEKAVKEIEKLLQQLASWKPSVYGNVEAGLGQLKEMYMLILKQIAKLPEDKLQATLLDKVQMHMLKQLEAYAAKNFGKLEQLFRQYGAETDRASLINSLFKATAGRTLPPDRIIKLLGTYSKNAVSAAQNQDTSPRWGDTGGKGPDAVVKSRIEGIPYQKQMQNVPEAYRKAFSSKKLIEADYMEKLYPSDRKEAKVSGIYSENSTKNGCIFLMRDLKVTEQFLEGLLGDGDLLRKRELTACNPQIKGFLAAATWVKAELFLQSSGIQKGLISSLVRAIDKMVHTYISAVAGKNRPAALTELPKNAIVRTDDKEMSVYNAYYQIKLLCQKERNKGKALSSGLRYAYTEFTKEKENEGFFFGQPGQGGNDCKKGFLVLKEDWKKFVDRLPVSSQKKKELKASFLSPWGDYVSPLVPLYNPELRSQIIIGGAVLIGFIILVSIFT